MRLFGLALLQNRYPALHGLRFLAIVSVLQVHVTVTLDKLRMLRHPGILALSQAVWFGMDLFFVLSGFLIGSMLLHQAGAGIGRFWLRRAFRTFPLYYVVLTGLVIQAERPIWTTRSLVSEYLYFSNYGGLAQHKHLLMAWAWSLCVEEHFYLVAPILVLALGRLRSPNARLVMLGLLWASALVVRFGVLLAHQGPWAHHGMLVEIYVPTHTRFDTLVAGVILAHLVHHHAEALRAFFGRRAARVGAWIVVFVCLLFVLAPPKHGFEVGVWSVLAWGTVTSVMYVTLVLLLLFHEGRLSRFLSARPFLYAATIGYGVYLVHIPLMVWVVAPQSARMLHVWQWGIGAVWWSSLGLLLVVSLAVAYGLHLLVEKPMLALRDRWVP